MAKKVQRWRLVEVSITFNTQESLSYQRVGLPIERGEAAYIITKTTLGTSTGPVTLSESFSWEGGRGEKLTYR